MNEVKFLIGQLRTTFSGDSWHGPCVMGVLEGVDVDLARRRVVGERHTVWELVDHMTFWVEEVEKSVRTKRRVEAGGDDWPRMGSTEEAWRGSVKRLGVAVGLLVDELGGWSGDDLAEDVPGAEFTFKEVLYGVVHHNLYHAGQINLLKLSG